MKNILFVIDSCLKCEQARRHLNHYRIPFDSINIQETAKIRKYKTYLDNQSLPVLLKEGKIMGFRAILELEE